MIENVARAKADAQKVRWDDGIPVRVIWRDGRVIWSKIDDEGRDLTTDNSDGMLHHVRSVFVPHGAINPLAAMTVQAEPVAWLYERDGRRHTSILRVTSPRDAFAGWTETPLYAHPPVPQWQGIETAPRGTNILVWFDHEADPYQDPQEPTKLTPYAAWAEGGECLAGKGWCIAKWHPQHFEAEDEYGTGYWMPAAWFAHQNGDWEVVCNPTHWMPLPTPLAGGSDAE